MGICLKLYNPCQQSRSFRVLFSDLHATIGYKNVLFTPSIISSNQHLFIFNLRYATSNNSIYKIFATREMSVEISGAIKTIFIVKDMTEFYNLYSLPESIK